MKATLLILSLLVIFTTAVRAIDINTPDGILKDVVVKKVVGEAVSVTHSEGTALIDFDLLPPAMQLEYGWTPEKSAERKAKIEAEKKRIADMEKEEEEAPKRRAMEAEAKKKAEEEKALAEERAKMKAQNAEFETEVAKTQEEQLAAAAKLRAELDRERRGGKGKSDEVPVAEVLGDGVKGVSVNPAPKARGITPGVGSVSQAIVKQNPLLENPKVVIGIVSGVLVVALLFMLPSGNAPKRGRKH